MGMMRTNLYIDQRTKDAINDMPKRFSASKLFRWFMLMAICTDKEWEQIKKNEPDILEIQNYMRPRLRRVLGLEDIKKK